MAELLTAVECAELARVSEKTWRSYVSRRLPRGNPVPESVGFDPVSGLRVWDAAQVRAWIRARAGRGARTDLRKES